VRFSSRLRAVLLIPFHESRLDTQSPPSPHPVHSRFARASSHLARARHRRRTMARAARGSDAARVDSPDDSGGASCEAPLAADAGASVDGASKPSDAPVVAGAPIAGAAVAGANGASAESAENKPVKNIARAGGGARGDAPRDGSGDGTLSVTPDSPADSEWRARRGPLDASEGGPWASEDAAGACDEYFSTSSRAYGGSGGRGRRARRRDSRASHRDLDDGRGRDHLAGSARATTGRTNVGDVGRMVRTR
jgi:hypothetical protein